MRFNQSGLNLMPNFMGSLIVLEISSWLETAPWRGKMHQRSKRRRIYQDKIQGNHRMLVVVVLLAIDILLPQTEHINSGAGQYYLCLFIKIFLWIANEDKKNHNEKMKPLYRKTDIFQINIALLFFV